MLLSANMIFNIPPDDFSPVRYPDYDFVFYVFKAVFKDKPEVIINQNEHKDFRWLSPKEALALSHIVDFDSCLRMFYDI